MSVPKNSAFDLTLTYAQAKKRYGAKRLGQWLTRYAIANALGQLGTPAEGGVRKLIDPVAVSCSVPPVLALWVKSYAGANKVSISEVARCAIDATRFYVTPCVEPREIQEFALSYAYTAVSRKHKQGREGAVEARLILTVTADQREYLTANAEVAGVSASRVLHFCLHIAQRLDLAANPWFTLREPEYSPEALCPYYPEDYSGGA